MLVYVGRARAFSAFLICVTIPACSLFDLSSLTGASSADGGDARRAPDGAIDATDAGIGAGDAASDATDALWDGLGDVGVIPDVVVPSCDGACGAPAGFAAVLFALNQTTSCPTGTTALNGAADPSIGGACACDCTVTQPPSCLPATLTHSIGDTAGACSTVSSLAPDVDGGCFNAGNVGLHAYWSIPPPPVTSRGTCSSTPADDPSAVMATASRLCLDSTCQATCNATAGFKTCLMAAGDVPCPGGYTTHHVGNVSVSCATCSACDVGGTCGGTVSIYSDTSCTSLLGVVGVDGGCAATGGPANLGSLEYAPAIVGESCTPGTTTGTVSLQQELTVCCP
jgi:hypothetical protein